MSDYSETQARCLFACRWWSLSDRERAALGNGCGSKGGWFDPPDYLFTASCCHHDFNYWLGGSEADRAKADRQFLVAMLIDASRAPWWARWWLRGAAWRYYLAVRWFGARHFNYRRPESNQETWSRLERAMSSR